MTQKMTNVFGTISRIAGAVLWLGDMTVKL